MGWGRRPDPNGSRELPNCENSMTGRTTAVGAWVLLGLGMSLAACSGGGGSPDGGSSCSGSSDCGAGKYCASGNCQPRLTVGACASGSGHASNDVCTSGSCLGGSCCAAA